MNDRFNRDILDALALPDIDPDGNEIVLSGEELSEVIAVEVAVSVHMVYCYQCQRHVIPSVHQCGRDGE